MSLVVRKKRSGGEEIRNEVKQCQVAEKNSRKNNITWFFFCFSFRVIQRFVFCHGTKIVNRLIFYSFPFRLPYILTIFANENSKINYVGTTVKPYGDEDRSKKEEVADMFNNISKKYDFLNHFLSVGIDKIWRKKAVARLKDLKPKRILDLATGTGDFALALLKLKPEQIVGMDISAGMLEVGREKMKKKGVDNIITMQLGDSENIPFDDNYFDGLTVGFGVRNYENLEKGLGDMLRVLRPGGRAVILEFSKPKKFPVKQYYKFHSKYVIPFFGKMVSKDNRAYTYLPDSIQAFPEGKDFENILKKVGYKNVKSKQVSGGIATIYMGEK